MLDFKIFTENCNFFFLQDLEKKFKQREINCKLIENSEREQMCLLSLNFMAKSEASLKLAIYEVFTDTLLTEYKLKFLNSNLTFNGLNIKFKKVLVKALCFFDRSIDQQIIYKELKDVKDTIFFESFLKFRLSSLFARWNELVKLVNSNANYFLNSETFVDFLKFLVDSIDYNTDKLDIKFSQNYYLINYKNKKEKVLRVEDNINLILKVMTLSPEKINIYINDFANGEELKLLSRLFDDRIEIINENKKLN